MDLMSSRRVTSMPKQANVGGGRKDTKSGILCIFVKLVLKSLLPPPPKGTWC